MTRRVLLFYLCVVIFIFTTVIPFLLSGDTNYGSPFIQKFTTKDFKAHPQNWAIIQDHRGFLYFANNRGVLEYDGSTWKIISGTEGEVFRSLAIDSNGIIFVGGVGELGLLGVNKSGEMKYISLKHKIPRKDRLFSFVSKICTTSDGVYFFTDKTIFFYNDHKIQVIHADLHPMVGFSVNNRAYAIIRDKGIGIIKKTKKIILPYTKSLIKDAKRQFVLPYSERKEEKVLIVTSNKGFYIYDVGKYLYLKRNNSKMNIDSILIPLKSGVTEYLKVHSPYIATILHNKQYAIGTLSGGIIIMDQNGNLVRVINKNRGLSDNTLLYVFEDRHLNLWGSTMSSISKIEINNPVSKITTNEGLNGIPLIAKCHDNRMYIGTMTGAFCMPNYKFRIQNDDFKLLRVKGIKENTFSFFTNRKHLYAVSSGDISLINGTESKKIYNSNNLFYSSGKTKKFPNHLFLGGVKGFCVVKFSAPAKVNNTLKPPVISKLNDFFNIKYQIRLIQTDLNNNLWLSTENNGLIYLQLTKKNLRNTKKFYFGKEEGLPNLKGNRLIIWNNKPIVATKKGLYKLTFKDKDIVNKKNVIFKPFDSINKGFGNIDLYVTYIRPENDKILWAFVNNKVYKIIRKGSNFYSIKSDILKKNLATLENIYFDKNNIKWICSSDGVFSYNSNLKIEKKKGYDTYIRSVTINNKNKFFYGSHYKPDLKLGNMFIQSSKTQESSQKIVFDYKEHDISFEFSASFYETEIKNQYSYKLEGFNKVWSDWSIETKAVYTNLSSGQYVFTVKAKNINGTISGIGYYKFSITPPWYDTIFANIIKFLLIFLFLILIVKLNSKRLVVAKKKLEKIVEARTIELEKLSIVARETNNAVIIADVDANIEWVNDGFVKMYEYTLEEYILDRGINIINSSKNEGFKTLLDKCRKDKVAFEYETLNETKYGEKIWVQTALTPILNSDNKVIRFVLVEANITKLKTAYEEMEQMSITDPLTKLNNRRYFHNLIDRDIETAKRKVFTKYKNNSQYLILFLMVDIDYFKKVNDTYGHQAGDQLLIQISKRMQSVLRGSDLLVRWGGEEFLIMTKYDCFEGAKQLSLKLLNTVEKETFDLHGEKLNITISIGHCGLPILKDNSDIFKWEDIIHIADSALYKAKENGRKRSAGVKINLENISKENSEILKNNFNLALEKGIAKIIYTTTSE